MYSIESLYSEAQEAIDKVWFVQSIELIEQTDSVISLRLYRKADLFVQAFLGEISNSLYFALVEKGQRIFGMDREGGEWHLHPFELPTAHLFLNEGLEPNPLLRFLARVERILLDNNLL